MAERHFDDDDIVWVDEDEGLIDVSGCEPLHLSRDPERLTRFWIEMPRSNTAEFLIPDTGSDS